MSACKIRLISPHDVGYLGMSAIFRSSIQDARWLFRNEYATVLLNRLDAISTEMVDTVGMVEPALPDLDASIEKPKKLIGQMEEALDTVGRTRLRQPRTKWGRKKTDETLG